MTVWMSIYLHGGPSLRGRPLFILPLKVDTSKLWTFFWIAVQILMPEPKAHVASSAISRIVEGSLDIFSADEELAAVVSCWDIPEFLNSLEFKSGKGFGKLGLSFLMAQFLGRCQKRYRRKLGTLTDELFSCFSFYLPFPPSSLLIHFNVAIPAVSCCQLKSLPKTNKKKIINLLLLLEHQNECLAFHGFKKWRIKMRSKTDRSIQGEQQIERFKGDGPNWILIAGGALLSTLSIRFVCKLKQAFEARGANRDGRKDTNKCGNGVACQLHSDMCCIAQEKSNCIHCSMGDAPVEIKQASNAPISKDSDLLLPLVKLSKKHPDGCTMWASSPELLELSNRPFHPSTGSESPPSQRRVPTFTPKEK
ncbi:hypothetical protein HPP92_004939 [Vanilla planifolia]|uniref:Uncharacterized protein n=1 Tax=Vanilla planifolia TaxID=51239 RepID=A0A835RG67_VANPL|nr:hypothetical protein HPP92_004939 [Vanilla planifolia]